MPTNRAGTPDGVHLERPAGFAKPLFTRIPAKKRRPAPGYRFVYTFGANSVAASTFTPGPMVEEIATRLM